MQRAQWISMVACLGLAASAAAGNLWIKCETGLDVYLDGVFVGVSEGAENGKFLPGISSGEHTIRIEKVGFAPVEYSIEVDPAPKQIVVGELGPEIKDDKSGATDGEDPEQLTGSIEITSDPTDCNVKIGDQRILKNQPTLTFLGVPAGEHKMWFEKLGIVLSTVVAVQETRFTRVMVDFSNDSVTVVDADSGQSGSESPVEEEIPQAKTGCIEFWVEVLKTSDAEAIKATREALKEQGFPLYHQKLIVIEDDGALPMYKLRVGPITRRNKAKQVAGRLKLNGFKSSWVVPDVCQ